MIQECAKEELKRATPAVSYVPEYVTSVSLGILKAFAPVLGTQIIMSIFLTHIFRLNTLVVLFGTSISNSLPAEIGNLMLKEKSYFRRL